MSPTLTFTFLATLPGRSGNDSFRVCAELPQAAVPRNINQST